MPFPTIQAQATSAKNTGTGTTFTVNLPTGIASGHLLLAIVTFGGEGGTGKTASWPAGWTEIKDFANGGITAAAAYRIADGTEGSSISVTQSAGAQAAALVYRITGQDSTVAPQASTGASGTSNAPDPDALTPSAGGKDYLWLAIAGARDSINTISAYPTNYTLGQASVESSASDANGTRLGSAGRTLAASTENPGSYTISGSNDWQAFTISIAGPPNVLTATVNAAVSAALSLSVTASAAIAAEILSSFLSSAAIQTSLITTCSTDTKVVPDFAVLEIHEKNGVGEVATNKTSGVIVYKAIDSSADNNDNPIILPSSGQTYSMQKWLRLSLDGNFFAVLNLKAYTDGANGLGTGIKLWWATNSTYQVPVVPSQVDDPPKFNGVDMTNAFFYTSASPINLGAGPYGIEDLPKYIGSYLVSVLEVEAGAAVGVTPTETISFAWDEV